MLNSKESPLNHRIYNSILELDQSLWNSLLSKDNIISRWEHLAAIEASGINDCDYQYAVFLNDEIPVACACYYFISFDLDIFNKGLVKKVINFIRKKLFPHFMRMRVIECGTPTALGTTVNWLEGTDHKQVLSSLVQVMKDFAREKKVKILIFRDFVTHDLKTFGYLKKLAFRKVGILPNTVIINQWNDFKEYEMDLKQHHRYIVRRYLRTLKENEVSVRVLTDYAHLAPELHRLWKGCYDHAQEYQREILTEEFFIELSRRMGQHSRLILFEKEGVPIGFLLGILNENIFQGLFAGMDYTYVREYFLLFNIYLAAIRLGIELGVKTIENGLTTIDEKMNFGFKPVPMHAYMRHLSPFINPVLSRLFALFSESTRFENKTVYNRRYSERIYGGINVTLIIRGRKTDAKLEDISETGARISSEFKIHSQKLVIHFDYPLYGLDYSVKTNVRWSVKQGNEFHSGLRFRDPDAAQIQTLLEYIINKEKEIS